MAVPVASAAMVFGPRGGGLQRTTAALPAVAQPSAAKPTTTQRGARRERDVAPTPAAASPDRFRIPSVLHRQLAPITRQRSRAGPELAGQSPVGPVQTTVPHWMSAGPRNDCLAVET
jgi:hypothetical protein